MEECIDRVYYLRGPIISELRSQSNPKKQMRKKIYEIISHRIRMNISIHHIERINSHAKLLFGYFENR